MWAIYLKQVVLHDVANDALFVEIRGAVLVLRPERLLEQDLHVLDVVPIPDGREKAVGEAHHQQILHNLLAQVAVHAVDLLLRKDSAEALA